MWKEKEKRKKRKHLFDFYQYDFGPMEEAPEKKFLTYKSNKKSNINN